MIRANLDTNIDQFVRDINKFGDHLKNQVVRAGAVAASKPMRDKLTQLASRFVGTKEPTITIKGVKRIRLRLSTSMITKIWKIPDGTGYMALAGPVSVEVPHAHWFGRHAPQNRQHKSGRKTGTHLGKKLGRPADIFNRAEAESQAEAIDKAIDAMAKKIQEFNGV
jgi:hypothetical protein